MPTSLIKCISKGWTQGWIQGWIQGWLINLFWSSLMNSSGMNPGMTLINLFFRNQSFTCDSDSSGAVISAGSIKRIPILLQKSKANFGDGSCRRATCKANKILWVKPTIKSFYVLLLVMQPRRVEARRAPYDAPSCGCLHIRADHQG